MTFFIPYNFKSNATDIILHYMEFLSSSSSDDYYVTLLNNLVLHIYRWGNSIIYILGTLGNLLSIGIFLRKKWRKNVCVFYFLVSLLLSLIYLNSTILSTSLITGWNINVLSSSRHICKVMFYVTLVTSTLIPTILIFASIDRLLISSQNVHTRLYSSKRLACLLIGASTAFWMIFNVHILVKVNIQQFNVSDVICYYDLAPFYLSFVNYSLTILNCLFCLSMIVLSVLSLKNVRRIRAVPRSHHREARSMRKRDFQLLRCLFIHDAVYVSVSIISTFYAVHRVMTRNSEHTALKIATDDFLEKLFVFIYFTFHCSSFFIFVCVSKAFRQEVRQLIYKMFAKDIPTSRTEQLQQQANAKNDTTKVNIGVLCANGMQS